MHAAVPDFSYPLADTRPAFFRSKPQVQCYVGARKSYIFALNYPPCVRPPHLSCRAHVPSAMWPTQSLGCRCLAKHGLPCGAILIRIQRVLGFEKGDDAVRALWGFGRARVAMPPRTRTRTDPLPPLKMRLRLGMFLPDRFRIVNSDRNRPDKNWH